MRTRGTAVLDSHHVAFMEVLQRVRDEHSRLAFHDPWGQQGGSIVTQGNGSVLAAKAVETQGNGSVLAAKAVETHKVTAVS